MIIASFIHSSRDARVKKEGIKKKLGTGKERRQNEKKLYLLVSHKRIKKKIWQNNNNGWMEKERDERS